MNNLNPYIQQLVYQFFLLWHFCELYNDSMDDLMSDQDVYKFGKITSRIRTLLIKKDFKTVQNLLNSKLCKIVLNEITHPSPKCNYDILIAESKFDSKLFIEMHYFGLSSSEAFKKYKHEYDELERYKKSYQMAHNKKLKLN